MSNKKANPPDDHLRQLLGSGRQRDRAADPRLRTMPCVHGGIPLEGGPRLDLDPPASQPAAKTPPERAAEQKRTGPPLAGPHFPVKPGHPPVASLEPALQETTSAEGLPDGTRDVGYQLMAIGLRKSYFKGNAEVRVLKGLNLGIRRGEFLAVVGQSGTGKSTLLHLLGTLDRPDKGEIHFEGVRIDHLPPARQDRLRNRHFGMIFQFYHLLPELTALENVLAPILIAEGIWSYWRRRKQHRQRARELLELVGISHREKHKPRELSGGEMQRAAIARALVGRPDVLLADEPTGNLDPQTGREIVHLLRTLNERWKLTIVMVTHDPAIAAEADRIVRLRDGRIEQ